VQQGRERGLTKRQAFLHQIQRRTIERAMFSPIMDLHALQGVGPRLAEHTINSIPLHPGPAVEDIQLKNSDNDVSVSTPAHVGEALQLRA